MRQHKKQVQGQLPSVKMSTNVSSPSVGGDMSLIKIEPLASRLSAWKAIPGVSIWVLETWNETTRSSLLAGHLHSAAGCRPSSRTTNLTFSEPKYAQCLQRVLVETVPLVDSESGFYSRYFLIPKKDGGFRPILDLSLLNRALMRQLFRMLTLKQILVQIRPEDWLLSVNLRNAYFTSK